MATRDVSISISADGEQQFAQAMRNAQSAMKAFNSELKASEAAYQENGDAQSFLAKKSQILEAQLEQNKTIVQAYERAIEDLSKAYGESDSRIDKYRIALKKANEAGSKMAKALRETQQEAEELGRDSTRIGRQLEDGIGDAADDVSDKLEEMTRRIEKDLGDIGGAVEFSAFKDAGEMMVGAFEQLGGFVEENLEVQRSLSYLEQNALTAGFEFEYVKALLVQITGITGDLDGAFEGISNLLAAGFDGKELAEAIELIGGAVISFPETMKFENLAESLQETIATGTATGAYAELLGRLEIDLEEVNAALAAAKTEEERQQKALAYLNEHGLEDKLKGYQDANKDMTDFYTKQTEFTLAQAELAKELTPAATAAIELATEMIEKATEATVKAKELWDKYQEGEEQAQKRTEEVTSEDSSYKNLSSDITNDIQRLQEAGNRLKAREMYELQQQVDTTTMEYVFGAIDEEEYKTAMDELGKKGAISFLESTQTTIEENSEGVKGTSKTVGSDMMINLSNGMTEEEETVLKTADSIWNNIKSLFSRVITIPKPEFNAETYNGTGRTTASSYAAGGQNNTVTVITQIDGETVGNATASSVGNNLGAQAQRASTYNR